MGLDLKEGMVGTYPMEGTGCTATPVFAVGLGVRGRGGVCCEMSGMGPRRCSPGNVGHEAALIVALGHWM